MKQNVKAFKKLTGYSLGHVARKIGVSTQHISKLLQNHSLVYKTSGAYILTMFIDEKIEELNQHIEELKCLKQAVKDDVANFKEGGE